MKSSILVYSLTTTVIIGVAGFIEWQRHQRQDQQLLAYGQHVQQLLGEVEAASVRRMDAERQLQQMRDSLAEVRSQMTSVSSQLQEAQERINPEYEAMEQRIRREVRNEFQSQRPAQATNSKTDLLRQLSQLDPVEMGEMMTLQTMYGGFLQALNVDDARLEVIVDGLSNMIAEQNQARMELMQQIQQNRRNGNPRQFGERMQAINNPEAQAEALSFILTDEEMALFEQFQASQPQQAFARTLIQSSNGGTSAGGVFLATPPVGATPGGIINYEIITADPPN